MWYRSDLAEQATGAGRMSLVRGAGAESVIPPTEFAINLSAHERLRTVSRIAAIPIHGSGICYFRIELRSSDGNWHEVGRLPLNIVIQTG